VKYVDASAALRILFREPGPSFAPADGDALVSSQLLEVEAFRAVDRERLLGHLDDMLAATKRKEIAEFLARLDLAPIDRAVIDRAKAAFGINVRSLDAIHVATAELLASAADNEALEFWTHDGRRATAVAG